MGGLRGELRPVRDEMKKKNIQQPTPMDREQASNTQRGEILVKGGMEKG